MRMKTWARKPIVFMEDGKRSVLENKLSVWLQFQKLLTAKIKRLPDPWFDRCVSYYVVRASG